MFKRNLEVKLSKPTKKLNPDNTVDNSQTLLYADIAMEGVREVARGAAIVVATYVTADMLRKVTVHVIATKFN